MEIEDEFFAAMEASDTAGAADAGVQGSAVDAQIQQYRHPIVSFLLGYRQSVVIHYLLLGFLILRVSGSFWQGLISV